MRTAPQKQAGVSLLAAIFLLVVLGALAAYMVAIGSVQQATPVFALQGAQAEKAARSGVEWALHRVLEDGAVAATCVLAPAIPPPINFDLAGRGLNGFSVDVECSYTQHVQGPDSFNVYAIVARAEFGSFDEPHYVSRSLEVTATDLF